METATVKRVGGGLETAALLDLRMYVPCVCVFF